MKTYKILVVGKVQGVWFRRSTREKARELGLNGEVRNLSDGSVEIVVTANAEGIESLREWTQVGPELAVVDRVSIEELDTLILFDSFSIVR